MLVVVHPNDFQRWGHTIVLAFVPGSSKVELEVNNNEGVKLLELKNIKVKKTTQLRNEINTLLTS